MRVVILGDGIPLFYVKTEAMWKDLLNRIHSYERIPRTEGWEKNHPLGPEHCNKELTAWVVHEQLCY